MNGVGIGNPRNPSFSSYLDVNERDFVRNLSESIHGLSPTCDSSSPRVSIGKRTRVPRDELSVFGAEKYFNEKVVNTYNNTKVKSTMISKEGVSTPNKQRQWREKRDHFERKSSKSTSSKIPSSLKSPTPSLKSEVSWNSQFGLFLPKKASSGLRILSGFQCKGSCFDKKSVHIVSTQQRVQKPPRNGNRPISRVSHNEHFAFPIIDTASPYHYKKAQTPFYNIDQPRKSKDKFGDHQIRKEEIEHNPEKKLSILAWDAIPNASPPIMPLPFPFSNTTKGFSAHDDDIDDDIDVRSECSSDLFEIDNLEGIEKEITNSTCMAPMTHFDAPSEPSIAWSAIKGTTDLSMICDDTDNEKIAIRNKVTAESAKIMKNSSASGLLCRNHKEVNVWNNNCHVSNTYRGSNEMIMGSKCDIKGSLNIAPSTPSRRSHIVIGTTMKNYAVAYA